MSIQDVIEELSENIVMVDGDDKHGLGDLHNSFENLVNKLDNKKLIFIAENVTEAIEGLILDEHEKPDEIIDQVGQVISGFQRVLIENKNIDSVEFPQQFAPQETETEEANSQIELPNNVDEEVFGEYLSKQESSLQKLEELLIEVENTDSDDDWRDIKSILHTMKGEAAMVGLDEIEHKCHGAEDIIEQSDPKEQIDDLFDLKDWLEDTFKSFIKGGEESASTEKNKNIDSSQERDTSSSSEEELEKEEEEERREIDEPALVEDFLEEAQEHIETLDQELLQVEDEPTDSQSLNSLFRAFHSMKGVAGFLNLEDIQNLSHAAEDLLDSARKEKIVLETQTIDIIFDAVDKIKELMKALKTGLEEGLYPTSDPNVQSLIDTIRKLNEKALQGKTPDLSDKKSTQKKQKSKKEAQPSKTSSKGGGKVNKPKVEVKETIKIKADKLDRMIDMIGEFVIAESMVSQAEQIRNIQSLKLEKKLNRLDKISRELQDIALSLRMVPVKSTFNKMARLVRDLSKKSGKPINFELEGKDTELDKSVVEEIGDPLVHLLRNAVDHGIEPPEEREKAGKEREGTICLRAYHKSGKVYIEVEDDGQGLDAEAIAEEAVEKGVIDSAEGMSKEEKWNLIFRPGFSTNTEVTDVSGRGVGMDVVRKNIESLRGAIKISSEQGKGSKFTIKLPLTLSVIDGIVMGIGKERFITPTLTVITSLQPRREKISTVTNKGEVLQHQDEMIPIFRLGQFFDIENKKEDLTKGIITIVESDGKKIGLFADELLDKDQIVIKSLSKDLKDVSGIAGGTIMPDGNVALILDIGGLVQFAGSTGKQKEKINASS